MRLAWVGTAVVLMAVSTACDTGSEPAPFVSGDDGSENESDDGSGGSDGTRGDDEHPREAAALDGGDEDGSDSAILTGNPICPHGVVEGYYRIYGREEIEALEGCTSISEWLSIESSNLQNLDGLEALESVSSLTIRGNDDLCRSFAETFK